MIKTYACNQLSLSMLLFVGKDSRQTRIEFTGGSASGSYIIGATYSTADPDIQQAIENSPYFRQKRIVLKPISEEQYQAQQKTAREYRGILNGQKAIEKLIEIGYSEEEIPSKAAEVAAFAKENNIAFPDWPAFNKN